MLEGGEFFEQGFALGALAEFGDGVGDVGNGAFDGGQLFLDGFRLGLAFFGGVFLQGAVFFEEGLQVGGIVEPGGEGCDNFTLEAFGRDGFEGAIAAAVFAVAGVAGVV